MFDSALFVPGSRTPPQADFSMSAISSRIDVALMSATPSIALLLVKPEAIPPEAIEKVLCFPDRRAENDRSNRVEVLRASRHLLSPAGDQE